ncbi:MAG: glycosyltransferase family 2 protein [Clostridiales bacterium]
MKKISVLVPCYNEEENIVPLTKAITLEFAKNLPKYDYELVFIDNCSQDKTQELLESVCEENKKVKAIFNSKNFGQFNSPYHGMLQTTGDCTICMCCDFQDPVSLIPDMVHEWEKGYKVVCAIKKSSKEKHIMRFLRSCYYKLIRKMSSVEQIEHFTGTGLYDKSFIETLRNLGDPQPFLRGIVAELGPAKRGIVYYEQQKRRAGKTHNNFFTLYDAAMLSFTSYTKIGLRLASISGFFMSGIGFIIALFYLIKKLICWNSFAMGTAPILIGLFLFSSILLFYIGFLGEYVLNINTRVMNRPLVVEEKRINFGDESR